MQKEPQGMRPWADAPTRRSVWITMWSKDKYGNIYPQAVHYAEDLSGECQPPYKGWFRATGYGHAEVEHDKAIGWTPLEEPASPWPAKLTPELADILGRPNFSFINYARSFRKAGVEIAASSEVEQAFFIHRWLGHWFAHGEEGWREAALADMNAVYASIPKPQEPA